MRPPPPSPGFLRLQNHLFSDARETWWEETSLQRGQPRDWKIILLYQLRLRSQCTSNVTALTREERGQQRTGQIDGDLQATKECESRRNSLPQGKAQQWVIPSGHPWKPNLHVTLQRQSRIYSAFCVCTYTHGIAIHDQEKRRGQEIGKEQGQICKKVGGRRWRWKWCNCVIISKLKETIKKD